MYTYRWRATSRSATWSVRCTPPRRSSRTGTSRKRSPPCASRPLRLELLHEVCVSKNGGKLHDSRLGSHGILRGAGDLLLPLPCQRPEGAPAGSSPAFYPPNLVNTPDLPHPPRLPCRRNTTRGAWEERVPGLRRPSGDCDLGRGGSPGSLDGRSRTHSFDFFADGSMEDNLPGESPPSPSLRVSHRVSHCDILSHCVYHCLSHRLSHCVSPTSLSHHLSH